MNSVIFQFWVIFGRTFGEFSTVAFFRQRQEKSGFGFLKKKLVLGFLL